MRGTGLADNIIQVGHGSRRGLPACRGYPRSVPGPGNFGRGRNILWRGTQFPLPLFPIPFAHRRALKTQKGRITGWDRVGRGLETGWAGAGLGLAEVPPQGPIPADLVPRPFPDR
jgi:hypothetical protein